MPITSDVTIGGLAAIEFAGELYIANGYQDRGAIYKYSDPFSLVKGLDGEHRFGKWTKKTYLNGKIQNVFLAKSKEKLYVFVNGIDVHTYDPQADIWTPVT